jgi:hypothetical protein
MRSRDILEGQSCISTIWPWLFGALVLWHWCTVRLTSSPPASYGVCRIEPYGLCSTLQVLRRIGTGWSTASSASVGRMVFGHFLQRDSHCLTSSCLASRLNETKLCISSEHQSLLRSTQGRRRVALAEYASHEIIRAA